MPVVIELPPQREQIAFHQRRWEQLLSDPEIERLDGRVETNRFGQIVMSPFASGWHGRQQMKIGILLDRLLGGESVSECPIITSDGVRLADVGWYSSDRFARVRGESAFSAAPEICVEILSPSNTAIEMEVKRRLYHEAGCLEFWTCDGEGEMAFIDASSGEVSEKSAMCPEFPDRIEI